MICFNNEIRNGDTLLAKKKCQKIIPGLLDIPWKLSATRKRREKRRVRLGLKKGPSRIMRRIKANKLADKQMFEFKLGNCSFFLELY